MARGFVKQDRCGGCRIEGFYAAGHGDSNARVGAAFDFFRKAGAFVANEQRDWLAPIDFPGSEERLVAVLRLVDAGSQCADTGNLELREKDGERHSGKHGQVQSGSGRGAQSFRREGACSAADAGGSSGGAGRAECGSGTQDGPDVSGILYACEDDEQRSASGFGRAH